jgi:nitroreductase
MQRRFATVVLLGSVLAARSGSAQELGPVVLPAPQTEGGMPLMKALKLRATARAFAPDPLPAQTLANLLWAAWGINRPQDGKRTAPSTRNWQEIEVVSQNVYLFCASEGLATGVRASIDRPALSKALKLRDSQLIVFAQSVGFPKK